MSILFSMSLVPKLTAHSMLSLWARSSVEPTLETSALCDVGEDPFFAPMEEPSLPGVEV